MLAGGSATDLAEMFKQSDLMDPPLRRGSRASFMEDLGRRPWTRVHAPASAVDTYKESVKQEKKKTRAKQTRSH